MKSPRRNTVNRRNKAARAFFRCDKTVVGYLTASSIPIKISTSILPFMDVTKV